MSDNDETVNRSVNNSGSTWNPIQPLHSEHYQYHYNSAATYKNEAKPATFPSDGEAQKVPAESILSSAYDQVSTDTVQFRPNLIHIILDVPPGQGISDVRHPS